MSSRGPAEDRHVRESFEFAADQGWDKIGIIATTDVTGAYTMPDLPAGTRFGVRRMDPTVFPVLGLALVSPTRDLVSLKDIARFQLAPLLSSVPGVASVSVLGGQEREYQVLADPARLQALGLSIEDLARALSSNNVVVAAGRLCDRLGMSVNISCKTGESSVACAAALHAASVIPNIAWGLTLTHTALGEDVTAHPVPTGNGHVEGLDRPGLGVDVDEDRVGRHRVVIATRIVA